jgi:hypothetical protein
MCITIESYDIGAKIDTFYFLRTDTRFARWYLIQKSQCAYLFWRALYVMKMLVIFLAIWHILWSFGIFSLILVCSSKKNLATPTESGS